SAWIAARSAGRRSRSEPTAASESSSQMPAERDALAAACASRYARRWRGRRYGYGRIEHGTGAWGRSWPHDFAVALRPTVAEELPGVADLANQVQVEVGDHDVVLPPLAFGQDLPAR